MVSEAWSKIVSCVTASSLSTFDLFDMGVSISLYGMASVWSFIGSGTVLCCR